MQIKRILEGIIRFFQTSRQIGHTTAAIKGAEATGARIVCADYMQSRHLGGSYRGLQTLALAEFATPRIVGVRDMRLVFDHYAVQTLASLAYCEIGDLESQIAVVTRERDSLARWKSEALTVESWWKRIDAAVRAHPEVTLGAVIADEALKFIRERDEWKDRYLKLAEAVSEFGLKSAQEVERLKSLIPHEPD